MTIRGDYNCVGRFTAITSILLRSIAMEVQSVRKRRHMTLSLKLLEYCAAFKKNRLTG